MAMEEHEVTKQDGRVLKVLEDGDRMGRPVLVHNGMPNSRLLFAPDVRSAQRLGIRLISYDRPGYGGSTRRPGRSVADCAEDVRTIARALDIDRLGVWGVSGGGPHAIACAALLPDLVTSVGVLASVAPWGAEGLDYFAGTGEWNVEQVSLMLEDPAAARARCEDNRVQTLTQTLPELMESLKTLLAPVDAAALTGELGQYVIDATRSGMATSSDGWWTTAWRYSSPGDSSSAQSALRSCCFTAATTASSHSPTASGSRGPSRASKPGSLTTTGI